MGEHRPGFSMIPANVLDSQEWRDVRGGARDVYTQLTRFASGKCSSDRVVWPGLKLLAELARMSESNTVKCIKNLEDCCLIAVDRGDRTGSGRGKGGRSRSNRYHLLNPVRPASVLGGILVDGNTVPTASDNTGKHCPDGAINTGHTAHKHWPGGAETLARRPDECIKKAPEQTSNNAASAAMVRIGVTKSKAAELAEITTADTVIRHWLTITGNPKNRVGVMIGRLRDGDGPTKQPTPGDIATACRDGYIASITLDEKTLVITPGMNAGANSQGVVIDGHTLPVGRISEAVFT